MEELEDRLRERDSEYTRLSKKIKLMERDNDVLTRTAQTYEAQARDLEREVRNQLFGFRKKSDHFTIFLYTCISIR